MEELSRQVTLVAFVIAVVGAITGLFLGYRAVKNAVLFNRQEQVSRGRLYRSTCWLSEPCC